MFRDISTVGENELKEVQIAKKTQEGEDIIFKEAKRREMEFLATVNNNLEPCTRGLKHITFSNKSNYVP